jgi:hypothetical protein
MWQAEQLEEWIEEGIANLQRKYSWIIENYILFM